MNKIILIFIIFTFTFTNNYTHIITYRGIELGSINNIDTYKNGYIKADISSFVLQLIFNREKFVWHKKGMFFDESVYKTNEDTYEYITLMKITYDNIKQGNYKIEFNEFIGECNKKDNDIKCTFKDTITKAIGNIVFDYQLNIIEYSDINVKIESIGKL